MSHLSTSQQLYVTTCPTCHVVHAIPEAMRAAKAGEGGWTYCPNGHQWKFRVTEADRLREQLSKEQRRVEECNQRIDRLNEEAERLARRGAAARGQVTKLRRRFEGGRS